MSNRRLHEARKARAIKMWQEGASTMEIAAELHLAMATVQKYVQPIRGAEKRRVRPTQCLREQTAKALRMSRAGKSNVQIALALGVAPNSVWRWIDASRIRTGVKAKPGAKAPKKRQARLKAPTVHICEKPSNLKQGGYGFDHTIKIGRTWGWA